MAVKSKILNNECFWDNFNDWIDYWRRNIHRFCAEYLGLDLKFFQKIVLYLMNYPSVTNFIFFASRGIGKSYLTFIFCLAKAILYPRIKIAVASFSIKQAKSLIEKINELRNESDIIDREILCIKMGKDEASIRFKNGSIIKTVVCADSARGNRANILILDESRLMDKTKVNDILVPFLTSDRKPPFLKNPKYKSYIGKEPNSIYYLTSIKYKDEWSYKDFVKYIDNIVEGSKRHVVFSLPYQFGVESNIITRNYVENQVAENKEDIKGFQMEMAVIPYGSSESSLFSFDSLNRTRKCRMPLIPPTDEDFIRVRGMLKRLSTYQRKQINEIRIISMDIAVAGGLNSDNTVFTVFRLFENGDYFDKELDYIEVMNGVNLDLQIVRLKQLFYDLECDYCVIDGGGAVGYNAIMICGSKTRDPNRSGVVYPAWKARNNLEKWEGRAPDIDAEPLLYVIQANTKGQKYAEMVTNMQIELDRGRISLLVEIDNVIDELNQRFGYMRMLTSNNIAEREKANIILGAYKNTTKLIDEAIKTKKIETKSGGIKLDEGTGKKDRIVSMLYGLHFIRLLEDDLSVVQGKPDITDYFIKNNVQYSGVTFKSKIPFSNNISRISRNGFGRR